MNALATLHHTCFVVKDVDRTARMMAETLSIRPWNVWTIEPTDGTVRGHQVHYSFRVALAEVGDSRFELLEPLDGDNVCLEHLQSKGEGFHHTCLAYETREDMHAAKTELLDRGLEMLQTGNLGTNGEHGEFCYFELKEPAAVLELLYVTELGLPEKVIG